MDAGATQNRVLLDWDPADDVAELELERAYDDLDR